MRVFSEHSVTWQKKSLCSTAEGCAGTRVPAETKVFRLKTPR